MFVAISRSAGMPVSYCFQPLTKCVLGGILPSERCAELLDEDFGHALGQINSHSLRSIASLSALEQLALTALLHDATL